MLPEHHTSLVCTLLNCFWTCNEDVPRPRSSAKPLQKPDSCLSSLSEIFGRRFSKAMEIGKKTLLHVRPSLHCIPNAASESTYHELCTGVLQFIKLLRRPCPEHVNGFGEHVQEGVHAGCRALAHLVQQHHCRIARVLVPAGGEGGCELSWSASPLCDWAVMASYLGERGDILSQRPPHSPKSRLTISNGLAGTMSPISSQCHCSWRG